MEKLAKFSVQYPVSILMLVLAFLLLGFISFKKLGMDLFPDLNSPKIFIELKAGERPPDEIEKQFVENIESIAIRQRHAVQVSSISRVGTAEITVEYTWDADMDETFLDLQKALTSFEQNSDIDELTISRYDPNAAPVMLLGFSHPEITDMDELRQVAENYIRNELVRLEGIAEVELLGQEVQEVVVETNSYLLEAFGITTDLIAQQLASYNLNMSGGSIQEMGRKYIIKGVGEFKTIEDIENVIVTYKQEAASTVTTTGSDASIANRIPVFLKDVAEVKFINHEPDNIVHVNGQRCMALAIYKETRFNTVKAVERLLDELDELNAALPGYEFQLIRNQGDFIISSVNEVKQTALIGVLLAVLVLFVFLKRIGVTSIISIAIPISIVATFNLLYFKGLTLNIMTLGGLALGAGMLVDNAIIVVENIYRYLEEGLPLKEAAIKGTATVGGAITASTLTTIVVFLPIVYLHGSAGELFKDQAWTVAFSLISSLFVAILVIPMLSVWLLKHEKSKKMTSVGFPGYPRFLAKVLNNSGRIILIAVILVIGTYFLLPVVGSEFIPKTESNDFTINIRLAEGTEINRTEGTVKNIETIVQNILGDEIEILYSLIGPTTSLTGLEETEYQDENTASILFKLVPDHKGTGKQIVSRLSTALHQIADFEFDIVQEQSELQNILGTKSSPIVVEIQGQDLETIQTLTEQAKQRLENISDLVNMTTNFDEGRPEVQVHVDRVRSGLLGINIETITQQIEDHLSGREAGDWQNEGESQDILVKVPDVSLSELPGLEIRSGDEVYRLDQLAEIETSQTLNEIYRRNQVRIGKLSAQIQSDKPLNAIVSQILDEMDQLELPPEYRYEVAGEELMRREAFGNLKFALLLSIILVYMVMASQFESLVHPFTILLTIPLAGVGSVLLFLIMGQSFNVMAFIGMIMLAGIAVNDSIILVDAINQVKQEGKPRREAILAAGQRRIRPIIMTSLTTILALLPLTLGIGEGASLRSPLALAVIGGLVSSTLLTLIVIPCVYLKIDRLINPTYPD